MQPISMHTLSTSNKSSRFCKNVQRLPNAAMEYQFHTETAAVFLMMHWTCGELSLNGKNNMQNNVKQMNRLGKGTKQNTK